MQPVQTFSTATLPARDRFAYWREERGKVLGVTLDMDKDLQAQFHGSFSARSLGGATLVDIQASSYRLARTEANIADRPADALCIARQVQGGGVLMSRGAERPIPAGTVVVGHADRPYSGVPEPQAGFRHSLLMIPFARYRPLLPAHADLLWRPIPIEPGPSALLAAYFDAFAAQASLLSEPVAAAAVQALAQLALLAQGLAVPAEKASRDAVRTSLLQKAHALIATHLHRTDLSPGLIAQALGVSPRQLHLLFEPTGTTFSATVMNQRLAEARRLLGKSPPLSVTDVAFACGFNSLSAFYRAFRNLHGMTPSDYRASL
ncbi:MAG TPA: AraC family transcriptional regulator [Vineibacter sp.]|nr:AraC family transcriptional regulator [Vineibacter sp.]